MINYLLKIMVLFSSSLFVIYNYYFIYKGHIENFDGYIPYLLIVGIFYGVYKYLQVTFFSESSKKISFSPFSILNYFLLHLLVLCILFFSFNNAQLSGGLILFFKIIINSFIPILIIFISTAFGRRLVSFSKLFLFKENKITSFLASLGIGFFCFVFLLDIIGILGFYNLYVVFGILILFGAVSYKQIGELLEGFINHKFEFELKEGKYLRLISTEIFFLISTLVLCVSLINIVRPFPIGWDDLGAYMNQPHLMAEAGNILSLGGMQSWQTFTGIGYMLGSPTQAFFFNVVGGFLSFITIVLVTSDLLKSKRKTFINIPLLIGTIFISMPMIVFQQAKDMKLDAGLFFVSIISLYLLLKYYLIKKSQSELLIEEISPHPNPLPKVEGIKQNIAATSLPLGEIEGGLSKFILFLIIGILAGFAFTIKFTSLLLISALIGVIFYSRLGLSGFLGYISVFFAIFTKGNLWKHMQVVVNPDKIQNFENIFSIISLTIGIGFLIYSFKSNKEKIKILFIELLIFLVGILIAVLPWVGKNIYISYPNINIGTIISGKAERFDFDLTKIYTKEKIEEINNTKKSMAISSSGTTTNEDFGRYFGYEAGINNYIKLPWNLTMQKNQGGEFTDIGFLYLALLPLILLFLPFKNKYYSLGLMIFYIFGLLLFFNDFLTILMSKIYLPYGYAFILGGFLVPTVYFLYTLQDTNKNYLFKLNLIFAIFYTFLWTISAFGVVWYGIMMYFSFLLMISLGIYYLSSYNNETSNEEIQYKLFGSIIILLIVFIYFFASVIPHSFNNLKKASYIEYKLGKMTVAESSYLYHPEYLKMLFEMNIADDKKSEFILDNVSSDIIKLSLEQYKVNDNIILAVEILRQYKTQKDINSNLKEEAERSLQKIYSGISNPKKEYKNKDGIYRIGTFMKYHISENNKRLLEDNLIFNFSDYIYNEDNKITIDNLRKLGLKYLLVDLNAATIDRDSRHNLTTRYEKLLSSFVSEELELIETDSICLKVGLEDYSINKNMNNFMTLAGVNYESYKDGKVIPRGEKALACYQYINDLLKMNLINDKHFTYLLQLKEYIKNNKEQFDTEEKIISFLHANFGNSFKVLFKIK